VVIIGSGRVGAGLAVALTDLGDTVSVVDKDPRAFERLGERFLGQAVEGIAFDRDVLERAGVARADALVAVTGGDNSNIVAARIARETYKVPRVIARIQDPRRATIYEELGVVTVATVGWTLGKIRDYLEHLPLKEEAACGWSASPGGAARWSPPPPSRWRRATSSGWPCRATPEGARHPARRGGPAVSRILVAGAGVWGAYIADHLVEQGQEVVVVEQDAAAAKQARSRGGRVVIAGDACEPSVLDRAGLHTVDTVVAATGDDEDNLLPSGGSGPLESGDEVLAVTSLDTEPALRHAIGGRAGGSHIPCA
jgi:Trk K+ transport system NAD-binding subunit